jgi:hypothetical protein
MSAKQNPPTVSALGDGHAGGSDFQSHNVQPVVQMLGMALVLSGILPAHKIECRLSEEFA